MIIDTDYNIDDLVYYVNEDVVKSGKIVQINASIDIYDTKNIKFTILSNMGGYDQYCEKHPFEVCASVDDLLNRLRDESKKTKQGES